MSQGLTLRQYEALNIIKDWHRRNGIMPTVRDLGGAMGVSSTNSTAGILDALISKGMLEREPHKARSLRLTAKALTETSHVGVTVTEAAAAALRALRRGDAEAAEALLAEVLGE